MQEIQGKITVLTPTEYVGEKQYPTKTLVIETEGQYPETWVIQAGGDKTQDLEKFSIGDLVRAKIAGAGREWNGKWYASNRLISCYYLRDAEPRPSSQPAPWPAQTPAPAQPSQDGDLVGEVNDDLPF